MAHNQSQTMETADSAAIIHDFSPYFRVYEGGRVERLLGTATVLPSTDDATGVQSKDVTISPESAISVRLYLPKSDAVTTTNSSSKLPVLIYFHGGGFCIESAASPLYHSYLNALSSESGALIVSVDYRLAPEHPIPVPYDDSWAALIWVGSHRDGSGPETWINSHADLSRIFFAGDSAGANIAHNVGLRMGEEREPMLDLLGVILVHPYFWGEDPIRDETMEADKRALMSRLWTFAAPNSIGCDDPMINPAKDRSLSKMGCEKVLVLVAEKDVLRARGWMYKEVMEKSGWKGSVEVMEDKGEDHVFHLLYPSKDKAVAMMKTLAAFIC